MTTSFVGWALSARMVLLKSLRYFRTPRPKPFRRLGPISGNEVEIVLLGELLWNGDVLEQNSLLIQL